eukprot:3931680-Rhodomonas_salina.1
MDGSPNDPPIPQVLSLYLARHQHLVKDKSVLELGCGLGLLSLMATDLGAREVFATDSEPSVRAAALKFFKHDPPAKLASQSSIRFRRRQLCDEQNLDLFNPRFLADSTGLAGAFLGKAQPDRKP